MSRDVEIGEVFERLAVIGVDDRDPKYRLCRCQCGREKRVRKDHLRGGKILSCGCLHHEAARQRALRGVMLAHTDGHSKLPEYNVWMGMRQRCNNPNNPAYRHYGGRGITICERWERFDQFLADMGSRPTPKHTIERRNNDLGYAPDNCCWALRKAQQRNQRVTRRLIIDGRKYIAAALADRSGLKADTIIERAERGLSFADVLSPERQYNLSGLALGGKASGARQAAKTHCKHGHPFDEVNTYHNGHQRKCRTCHRERERARRSAT